MQESNRVITQNIETVEKSKAAIEENTRHIERSTNAMERFQYLFPIFFFATFLALLYICMKLRILHRIFKDKDSHH